MTASARRRQAGFTLPEILAVIALIGILVSTMVNSFDTASEDLARTQSLDTLLNDIPTAMLSYRAVHGGLTGIAKADITDAGVDGDTPFGDAWTLGTATTRTVALSWVLTSAPDPADFSSDLGTALDNASGSAATSNNYAPATKTLTVNYRVP